MPLMFDMPLEQLRTYQGKNPKPADVDQFWNKGVSEAKRIDPELELIPSIFETPFADCSDMYFSSVSNARIHAKLLCPKRADNPHPAILMFHGYAGDAGDWTDKQVYAALGFTVAAMDCRRQGGLSEDSGDVKGNTFLSFSCDHQRTWEIDLAEHAYEELRNYFCRFDPLHEREIEVFTKLGYIDVQHLCSRIKGEVFMGVGLMDKICPPSTQFVPYNKISSKKSMAIYPD